METTSDTLTVLGLKSSPVSPYLLGAGTGLGIINKFFDDDKSFKQKVAEIFLSTIASNAAGKVVKGVNKLEDGKPLYSETTTTIFSEASGKVAEKIPESINSCNKDPKQIGCGGVSYK